MTPIRPVVAFVTFRISPTDGVSVVLRQWTTLFEELGFDTVTIGGSGADVNIAGLDIGDTREVDTDALRSALTDCDLIVVENLLTIPLNLPASRAVARECAGRPTIVHHHDPPWERARFEHVRELPVDDPSWQHVVLTEAARAAFEQRDIRAAVIPNGFDSPGHVGADRAREVRTALGVGEGHILVVHPVRAIERKNIPAALRLAEHLGATYWLSGPCEEGYEHTWHTIRKAALCPVIHRPWTNRDEMYSASDLVVYPSKWEGFGNPPIEAALRGKPVVVGRYPASDEQRDRGLWFLDADDLEAVELAVDEPDPAKLERNREVAELEFGRRRVRRLLTELLDLAGWLP